MDKGESSGHLGETQHVSELRIVLLGAKEGGKSSAGNAILGKQEFTPGVKTTVCKKGQGDVRQRQVTVVDTPGWVCYFPVEDSPELLKDQIVCTVSLCPPGPHAVLLVINLNLSFQEKHRRAVQEHLELLSDSVWRHTILLFTFEDTLREMTIKQHIEREGQALQWVIEKCGNRYHVLSSKNSSEVSQVSELLEMIEKMVVGNGGCHFHMERKVLQDMEEKSRITEERANQRVRKVREHRETLRDPLKGETSHPSRLRVVLLGWVVGGKSSAGNTILGRQEFGFWRRTEQCEKKQGEVVGRQVTVVDTPGWWKFIPAHLTPDWIKEEVVKSLALCHPGPHAILLVIPADTAFKEEQRKIIRDNMKHLGEGIWRHTLVLFTWGECLGNISIEQHIEREGHALQWLIEKCGNRYHVLCNMKKEDRTQVTELLEKIEEMVAGKSVFNLLTETQGEVVEKIEEMDRETKGADLSTEKQKDPELMQIIDELWIRREEHQLEKLGLDREGKSKVLPPAELQEVFEKEWSRIETGLKLKMIQERITQTSRGGSMETPLNVGNTLCESGSSVEAADSTEEEGNALKEAASKRQTQQWIEREDAVFEKEWDRREWEMYLHFKRMIQDWATLPVRGAASNSLKRPYMREDTSSEPETSRLAKTCMKVCDWMSEKHSGNSAAASGYETNSEMSNTETSDITGRDEELGHCGAADRETQHVSELRIVLLGAKEGGKSSAGNAILGKQEFTPGVQTAVCKKGQGDRRQITVVDTPGWFRYFPVEDSPELLKDQIVCSVSLCPPGPHAVLLVINLSSSFQEKHRRAVQEHLELLSDSVWRHTILLFTFGDTLREMTMEQYIEREGQALQWVIEKCGNRYHVLSSKNSSEVSQVSELLEMIEKMVVGNGSCHFHMERKVLQVMEEKRRITEERANQRVRKVREHKETLRHLLKGGTNRPFEMKVVLLGWVVGGKSSAGNIILGREEFGVWRRTAQCEKKQGEVAGRQVTVVDTPGWWKFIPAHLTPDWIKEEVVKSLTLCHPGPHAILLVIPADTTFKEEQRKIIRDNMKHLGERVWGHTLVLFTWGECLGNISIEQHIEREGHALQWLIEKCGNRYHVLCNMKKEDRTQVTELLEKIEEMVAGKSVFHLLTETQGEVVEEIEEMDRETWGADLSIEKQKVPELIQIIDELWIRREEHLLGKLGLDCTGKSKFLPPAELQKVFEKEWSRIEIGLKLKKMIQERTTQTSRGGSMETPLYGGNTLCESGSSVEAADSTEEEGNALKEAASKTQTQHWIEREDAVFEKEWDRREWEMYLHFKRMIQDCATLPVRGAASNSLVLPNMREDTSSEPETSRLAKTCMKVCDWMSEKHSGNSAAASGYETNSEMSNTETSDITGRDEELGHCGAADT
ncbi:uncharacterized protein LOC135258548 [Anguilla rostrata]|uniref:uncharacterized protein LOC135258548 n=1 Tax=Anguilla rostrata TaxID=7938 RepID=UPI0030D4C9A7